MHPNLEADISAWRIVTQTTGFLIEKAVKRLLPHNDHNGCIQTCTGRSCGIEYHVAAKLCGMNTNITLDLVIPMPL